MSQWRFRGLILCVNLLFLGSLLFVLFPRVPVLCLHRVLENPAPESIDISRKTFLKLLDYLKERGYAVVPPREARGLFSLEVVLSFDDGSPEHLTFVMPELKRRGGRGLFFWVSNRLNALSAKEQSLLKTFVPSQMIGSHSKSHRSLKPLVAQPDGEQVMIDEVEGSQTALSQFFGISIQNFAFPGGESEAVSQSVVSKFYLRQFSTDYGYYYPWLEGGVHGRMLIFQQTSLEDIQSYLDGAEPWKGIPFLIQSILTLFLNFLYLRLGKKGRE
jgi:peptidoglycan/xylan/chitin deacetylase (PgdA/CDA1 family)